MKRKLIGGTTSTSLLALRAGEALAPRIIRKPEVERLTGYSGVQIWRLERGGAVVGGGAWSLDRLIGTPRVPDKIEAKPSAAETL